MDDLYINLEVNPDSSKNLINGTNAKEEQIDNVLSECYRSTLENNPDYRVPKEQNKYNIRITLSLEEDIFNIKSDTGNKVLTYELIKGAIGNWELKPTLESKVNKPNLGKQKINLPVHPAP